MIYRLLFTVLLLLQATFCFGWNDTGHRLTGIIAYQQMGMDTRKKVISLIRKHPFYQQDFSKKMPRHVKSASKEQQEMWLMGQAAVWPDIARSYKGNKKKEYDRSKWHYINFPLFPNKRIKRFFKDDVPVNLALNPSDTSKNKNWNAVQALIEAKGQLQSEKSSLYPKSIWLCWYLHIAGDLHQPLHSVAMFTANIFPKGDRGGNDLEVNGKKLHSIWDGGVGKEKNHRKLIQQAEDIYEVFKNKRRSENISLSAQKWVDESRALAKKYTYTSPIRKTISKTDKNNPESKTVEIKLSNKYRKKLSYVSRIRIAITGERISQSLHEIL